MAAAVAATLASGGVESLGFLNDILEQLWQPINTAAAKMVKDVVEPMFKETLPGPLKNLHFVNIDLGKKPIRFDNIDVFKRSANGIKLDVDIAWDGECDIDLKSTIVKFGVERVKLTGRMSILLSPIIERIPIVSAMQLGFINPPELSLDFTGAADIADLSIIDDTIRKIIQDVLAGILVLPNRFLLKVDPLNDYFQTYQQHLGFLRVTVVGASGYKKPKGFLKDIPDLYCKVRLGANKKWKTSTKNNQVNPEWNETTDFLLSDYDQILSVAVWDDDFTKDDKMGIGTITPKKLLMAGDQINIPLLEDGQATGAQVAIKAQVYEFIPDVTSFEDSDHQGDDLLCGLITILVAGVKGICVERKDASTSVRVTWGGETFCTPCVIDAPALDPLNPAFDKPFRIPLSSEKAAEKNDFNFELLNNKKEIGSVCIPYDDVINAPDLTLKDSFDLQCDGATISASISIRGIKLSN